MVNRYVYEITPKEQTGFPVVSCTDTTTGIVVRTPVASNERSYPAMIAYVGAKFSRDRAGMVQLMGEVEQSYKDGVITPEGRLASIVNNLKHQSPGGMAHVTLSLENIPILTASSLWRRTTLHDGQETSTRFARFDKNSLPELKTLLPAEAEVSQEREADYRELQKEAINYYQKWIPRILTAYKEHFKIGQTEGKEYDALVARTFDTVRGFLLIGLKTSMVYVTNATTMQQWLGNFNAGRLPGEEQLAKTVLALLRPEEKVEGYYPEIKPLLKHTDADYRTRDEQRELKEFFNRLPGFFDLMKKRKSFSGLVENRVWVVPQTVSPTDKIVAQHLEVLYPSLDFKDALDFVRTLNDEDKVELGRIIFKNRDRFYLPAMAASGGSVTTVNEIDFGLDKDFGRHRAWERVGTIHETYEGGGEIFESGFTQIAYLRQIPKFRSIQTEMEGDSNRYYRHLNEFREKLGREVGQEAADKACLYLLPQQHQVGLIMNSDIRNVVHLNDIRIRGGAHIDARLITASQNAQVAAMDPLYRSWGYAEDRVLVDDRAQFIDRS